MLAYNPACLFLREMQIDETATILQTQSASVRTLAIYNDYLMFGRAVPSGAMRILNQVVPDVQIDMQYIRNWYNTDRFD